MLVFGLARMFEMLTERGLDETRVFNEMEASGSAWTDLFFGYPCCRMVVTFACGMIRTRTQAARGSAAVVEAAAASRPVRQRLPRHVNQATSVTA